MRGRGKAEPHRKAVGKEEQQIPTISIDYGFFGDEGVGGSEMPVLIVFDRWSKCIWSHPVPSKGVGHPWSSTALLRDLEKTGYRRLVLKSDQENSIKALAKSAKDGFKGEVILEHSPKGESKSNGEVERAVQSVHGLARTLKDFVEQKSGIAIDPKSPILAWLIEYSDILLNLFHRGEPHDGVTAFHRLKGRPWRVELPAFGETVEFLKRTRRKLEQRWEAGVFLGVKETTTEKIVGTNRGIFVVQSVRRRPAEARFNGELLTALRGFPWAPSETEEAELPEPISLPPALPEVPATETPTFRKPVLFKRHYIVKADLEKYGYTAGCPACDEIKLGPYRRGGIVHTDLCRERVGKATAEDPERRHRLEQSEARAKKHVRFDDGLGRQRGAVRSG